MSYLMCYIIEKLGPESTASVNGHKVQLCRSVTLVLYLGMLRLNYENPTCVPLLRRG